MLQNMKAIAMFLLGVLVAFGGAGVRAQQISPLTPPPPPPAAPPPAPPQPAFDPYHAAKSIEIGTFYMEKGKLDAAIDRFHEAATYQPGLAEPWRLLGEAYEKKHDYRMAVDAYNKYLQVFPGAPDATKVRARVVFLQQKIGPETAKH